jgi:hypothetical protein
MSFQAQHEPAVRTAEPLFGAYLKSGLDRVSPHQGIFGGQGCAGLRNIAAKVNSS